MHDVVAITVALISASIVFLALSGLMVGTLYAGFYLMRWMLSRPESEA